MEIVACAPNFSWKLRTPYENWIEKDCSIIVQQNKCKKYNWVIITGNLQFNIKMDIEKKSDNMKKQEFSKGEVTKAQTQEKIISFWNVRKGV